MAKWSEDTTVKFVSEYIVHECLWNVKNNLYQNKQARHTAYTAIKEIMDIPEFDVNAVITKIKNIRSTYSQEVKKINESKKSGAGADSIYKPSLKWFVILDDVLRGVNIENRQTQSNMNPIGGIETDTNEDAETSVGELVNNDDQTRISRKRNIRGLNSLLDKARGVVNELNADTPVQKEVISEFEVFGKGVGMQLNAMSLENALRAQSVIQNYLSKVRLQELTTLRELRTSSLSDYSASPPPQDYMTSRNDAVQTTYEYTPSPEAPTNRGHSSQSDYFVNPTTPGSEFILTYNPNVTSNTAQFTQPTAAQQLTFTNNTQRNDILQQAVANIPHVEN